MGWERKKKRIFRGTPIIPYSLCLFVGNIFVSAAMRLKSEPAVILLQVHFIVIPVVFQSIFVPCLPHAVAAYCKGRPCVGSKKNAYTSFFKIVYSYVGFAFVYFSVTDFNPTNSHVSRLASRRHLLLHCQICLFYLSGRSSAEPG